MRAKIYVEGGGERSSLDKICRQGFSSFFKKASLEDRMPRIVACGPRKEAYNRFRTALKSAKSGEFIVLLVDSESPVVTGNGPWKHLKSRRGDNWNCPAGATDENAHLMVQCMESWFLADMRTLANFYGSNFNEKALSRNPKIEKIEKRDVLKGMKNATRRTQKGVYNKGSISYEILNEIDPKKVVTASPHAKRLISTLKKKIRG